MFIQPRFLTSPSVLGLVLFSLSARSHIDRTKKSPYLDNHISESIHTWIIGTLLGWLSFHDIGLQGLHAGGWGWVSKYSTSSKCCISVSTFSRSTCFLMTTYQKAFIHRYSVRLAFIL